MKLILTYLTLLLVVSSVISQEKIKFGDFDKKYFKTNHCPIDSSAGAYVIKDYGRSSLNHNYELEFEYHGIIKILSKDQFDLADVEIRHHEDSRVSKFKASTYNYENGKIVESTLKRKDANIESIDDDTKSFKFNLPNVRENSIIEYTYSVTSGNLTSLKTWAFQTNIPVLKSQYEVLVPNYFDYERLLQGYHPLTVAEINEAFRTVGSERIPIQHHNYVALNVPAFKNEPYITTSSDYISKINFELKKYQFPGQIVKTYLPENYASLAKGIYESEYQKDIEKANFVNDITETLKANSNTEEDLAKSIYYFVRDNFQEDYNNDYLSLRKVFSEKKGTASDINRILASMLIEAGIKTNLVRISTRKHGRVNPYIPIARQFNLTIVKIKIGDVDILLDATDENTPYGALPKYCINGKGLVIAPIEQWIKLEPFDNNGTTYSGIFEVSNDGILSGNVTIRRTGYEAWSFKSDLQDDGVDDYKQSFYENNETWEINEHEVGELVDSFQLDENIELDIEDKVDDLGDLLYLNPIIIGQVNDNPFKTEGRKFPVNFGAPFTNTHIIKYLLADGLEVVELPTAKSISLPNNSGKLLYSASLLNNEIVITTRIQINKSEFSAEEYPYLREFYAQIVERHGQQIVMKRQ
ncbi:DUF3857 domain-containing protein [Ekhidna sp.]|uniref:DUF3857 domain-containing protein n=1 Tax=Ekhidna sp. TaxID=2608089 RepID=UPI003C79AE29